MIGTGRVKDDFKMYSSSYLQNLKEDGRIYQDNTIDTWNIVNFWTPVSAETTST